MPTVLLVGAEFEENLSLRYLAAAVQADGLRAELEPCNRPEHADRIVARALALKPLLIGLSVPFQTRAPELLALAERLRDAGYDGHITVGGHFATFEYAAILRDHPGVDSAVRHEGEDTLRELCAALLAGEPLAGRSGLVVREGAGLNVGPARKLPELDALPWPDRRGEPQRILGVLESPLLGSRGCYADCAFCCIYAYSENAAGPRYRRRSVQAIVQEMVAEYHQRDIRLFIFHDDNFFLPNNKRNLERYTEMAERLRAAGLDDIALVVKCRPNDVEPELFRVLQSMGVIRAYVGIETNSDEGLVSLNRRITTEDNRRALQVFEELGVYCSFNILLFDPEATFEGVEANLAFMDTFAHHPFNFCRAEIYAGTPLKQVLAEQGRLQGGYLAWTYAMRDPRVELLFRIFSVAWSSRNYKGDGVANLSMGVRFDSEVMRRFYPRCWDRAWQTELVQTTTDINRDSVARLRQVAAFAATVDLRDAGAVRAFTLATARKVARADLGFLRRIKAQRREMERRLGGEGASAMNRELDVRGLSEA